MDLTTLSWIAIHEKNKKITSPNTNYTKVKRNTLKSLTFYNGDEELLKLTRPEQIVKWNISWRLRTTMSSVGILFRRWIITDIDGEETYRINEDLSIEKRSENPEIRPIEAKGADLK